MKRAMLGLLLLAFTATSAAAGLDTMQDDGWYTWQITGNDSQVYVRIDDGEVDRIQVLNPDCHREPKGEIRDLGIIDTTESLSWLESQIASGKSKVRKNAVFALSLLPPEQAVDSLRMIIEDRDRDHELREIALFSLVNTDSDLAYAYLDRLLADGN
jgi:HEAT repeat protein